MAANPRHQCPSIPPWFEGSSKRDLQEGFGDAETSERVEVLVVSYETGGTALNFHHDCHIVVTLSMPVNLK